VIGELLLCPWCASVWIATLLIFSWILLPGVARAFILAFGVAAAGMLIQILVKLLDEKREGLQVATGSSQTKPH
ncbi:MAG: DUF1360 domain-containing protein, partial [Armatimonadota bacterium]|nr:DUF1360 domain-containing protein [Armatimonadota bacterium]